LLIPYGSFAETKSDENYPDAIKCIVDKYVASFPKVKRFSEDIKKNYLWLRLSDVIWHTKTDINSIHVKSVETFFGERDVSEKKHYNYKKHYLALEIWTMETSMDANRLSSVLRDVGKWVLEKPPSRFFVYDNIFVLLWVGASNEWPWLQENACEIIQTCFECGDIDDRFNGFVNWEKRCDCGNGKDDEKERRK
jgi:hypothetical protein